MNSADSPVAEQIVLVPHRSLSVRGARWFFVSLCIPSLGIALLMTALGYWPILPFAGLELLAVGAALSINMRRRADTQQIVITGNAVAIDSHRGGRIVHYEFSRHWAQVKLRRAKSPWHPSRLTVESHGRACELGSFLTEEDRCALAGRLRRLIGRVDESPRLWPDDCTIKV
jgi:uncharacterized membrane protein